jgi:BirA family biotin operon repressor/biotin-[acetyl-CoA-carboxylase] ligase
MGSHASSPYFPRVSKKTLERSISTTLIGRPVYYVPEISSTNTYALTLCSKGAKDGTLVITNYQTHGRGRQRRSWRAPRGKALLFSLLLTPPSGLRGLQLLTIIAAVSVCEAIRQLYGLAVSIKWPNDILIDGRKVCGILTELTSKSGKTAAVVVGIGININQKVSELPRVAGTPATSLLIERGEKTSRLELLPRVLERFEHYYRQFCKDQRDQVINQWRRLSSTQGKQLSIQTLEQSFIGTAVDIEADGGLVIRKDNGFMVKLFSADIHEIKILN